MTLALALSLGGVAIAAPPPPPPSAPAADPAVAPAPAAAAPAPAATPPPPADPKAAKQAWKAAKKAEKQAKKAERRAKKQAKKAAKQGKQSTPSTTGPATTTPAGGTTTGSPTGVATTPAPTGVATTTAPDPTGTTTTPPPTPTGTKEPAAGAKEPAAGAKEPATAGAGLTAMLPVEVQGSLSKDSRRTLSDRLQAAAAAAKVSGGPYRVRLSLRVSKKKDYALVLTVLGADDATLAAPTDECKKCSLEQVGASIDALVQQAASGLAPKEPPPPVVAEVSVRTDPLGARVRVDGAELGLTPQVLELPPGEHTIAVDKPGFLPQEQKLTVEAGAAQQVDVKLVAEPPAKRSKRSKEPSEPTAPADPSAGRGFKIGGAVMLGLGIAGVATGVAMILIDEEPKPLSCSGTDVDFRGVCRNRYDTLLGGIVGVAAGGLGIGGGVAMMIQGRRVSVRARAGKQQVSLGLVVRF